MYENSIQVRHQSGSVNWRRYAINVNDFLTDSLFPGLR